MAIIKKYLVKIRSSLDIKEDYWLELDAYSAGDAVTQAKLLIGNITPREYVVCVESVKGSSEDDNGLLPCPFCGGEAKEEPQRGTWGGYKITNIYCQKCSASISNKEHWNKRI